ncbi:hypothetical protein JCM8547_006071 [Rhodosporidiobolus lusitaniae]
MATTSGTVHRKGTSEQGEEADQASPPSKIAGDENGFSTVCPPQASLSSLPLELFHAILAQIDDFDFSSCCLVNRAFLHVVLKPGSERRLNTILSNPHLAALVCELRISGDERDPVRPSDWDGGEPAELWRDHLFRHTSQQVRDEMRREGWDSSHLWVAMAAKSVNEEEVLERILRVCPNVEDFEAIKMRDEFDVLPRFLSRGHPTLTTLRVGALPPHLSLFPSSRTSSSNLCYGLEHVFPLPSSSLTLKPPLKSLVNVWASFSAENEQKTVFRNYLGWLLPALDTQLLNLTIDHTVFPPTPDFSPLRSVQFAYLCLADKPSPPNTNVATILPNLVRLRLDSFFGKATENHRRVLLPLPPTVQVLEVEAEDFPASLALDLLVPSNSPGLKRLNVGVWERKLKEAGQGQKAWGEDDAAVRKLCSSRGVEHVIIDWNNL